MAEPQPDGGRWTVFGRPVPGLGRPVGGVDAAVGWTVATVVFVVSLGVWVAIGGLPTDTAESTAPAVAIAHGQWRCAYPAAVRSSVPPLYPLLEGGVMAGTGLGTEGFPARRAFGTDCGQASAAVTRWEDSSRDNLLLGLLTWPALLAGLVAVLRAAGRGRTRGEGLIACLVAGAPPLALTLVGYFHPEDLLALGLVLGSVAAALRSRWVMAGVLVGLACTAKQYAVLAAVPLVVAVPARARLRLAGAAVAAAALVVLPLAAAVGSGLVHAVVGADATSAGTAPIGRLGLGGWQLTAASRLAPIVLAAVAAVVARRRLGDAVCRPAPLVALVATALALRLVFEVNLYGYYGMATSVALLLLDGVTGRVRTTTVAWIAVVTLCFSPAIGWVQRWPAWSTVVVDLVVAVTGVALPLGVLAARWPGTGRVAGGVGGGVTTGPEAAPTLSPS